jgi:hypothetical protein
MVTMKRLYHGLPASSTPHRPVDSHPHPPLSSLSNGSFGDRENAFSYTMDIAPYGRTLQHQPLDQGPARGTLAAYVPRLITSPSS